MADVLSATKQFKRLYKGTIDPTLSWDSKAELLEYLSDPTCPKNMVVASEGKAYVIYENDEGILDLSELGAVSDTELGKRLDTIESTKYDKALVKQQEAADGTITPFLEFYANGVLVDTLEIGGNGLTTAQLDNINRIPEAVDNAAQAYDIAITNRENITAVESSLTEEIRTKANVDYVDAVKEDHDTRLDDLDTDMTYVLDILDELTYKDIACISYTINPSSAEMGSTVSYLELKWEFNKVPTSQSINGESLDPGLRIKTYSNLTSSTTFGLVAGDGTTTVRKNVSLSFLNGKYYGSRGDGTYNSSFIASLRKVLTSSRTGTFTTTCNRDQYIFFAIPTRFGTPSFTVGGFSGGFAKAATVDFTNASGYTEPYDIYKSDNSNLGSTTVVVG